MLMGQRLTDGLEVGVIMSEQVSDKRGEVFCYLAREEATFGVGVEGAVYASREV